MKKYSTEDIEQYLEHNLSQTEEYAFKQALSENQELQKEVEAQRKIAATLAFAGFQSSVHAAHDRFTNGLETSSPTSEALKTKSGWSFTQFFGVFILVAIGIIGLWKLTESKTQEPNIKPTVNQEKASISIVDTIDNTSLKKIDVEFNTYTFLAEEGTTINDPRSGAKITIEPNSLVYKTTKKPVKGKVKLAYREFRDQADIALSEIPMDYKGKFFNSAGMFEIRSTQGTEDLTVKDGEEIDIDFRMTKNEDGIGFYELNNETKKWRKLKDLPLEKQSPTKTIEPTPEVTELPQVTNTIFTDDIIKPLLIGVTSDNSPYIDPEIINLVQELSPVQESIIPIDLKDENWTPKSDVNKSPKELFFNESYDTPVGDAFNNISKMNFKSKTFEDPTPINIEIVSQKNEVKTKKNKKRTRQTKDTLATIDPIKIPEWSNPFSVATKVDTVTIFDNSSSLFFKELEPLKEWVFYDRTNQIYRGDDIFDIRIDLDSSAKNLFILHLKHSSGITSTPVSLVMGKMNRQIIQRRYENYLGLRNARMQRIIRKATIYKQKIETIQNEITVNEGKLDQLINEKDDKIYAIAQLTMSVDELAMSKDEWFEKMASDSLSMQNLKTSLQKIKAYSTNDAEASNQLVDLIQKAETRKAQIFYIKKVKEFINVSAYILAKPNELKYSDYSFTKTIMSKTELLLTFVEWKDLMVSSQRKKSNRYKSFISKVDTMTTGHKDFYLSIHQKHRKTMEELRTNKRTFLRLQEVNKLNNQAIAKSNVDNGTMDAGHYKDPFVKNLKIKNFGVFNCDQVYQLANAIQLKAHYYNNGIELKNNRVLSVIDKGINGSLSFAPKLPTVSTSSNTCLLLVTKDDRYYFYSSEDWKGERPNLNSKDFEFIMTEVTDKLKSSKDLQALIEGVPMS